jgi:uncharacterized membrane protein HdeD (DUF308 family)
MVALTPSSSAVVRCALLVAYPLWDAIANVVDARRSGGLAVAPGQRLNAILSVVAAVAMGFAFGFKGDAGGLLTFGAWAMVAGLCQLAVGIQRRKLGGQVIIMISGAQSALVGAAFVFRSLGPSPHTADLWHYALLGGVYFAVSGLWLAFKMAPASEPQ